MKKKDLLLTIGLLASALILWLLFSMQNRAEGNSVIISVDGALYGTYGLHEKESIEISTDHGVNVLHIADGSVWMEEADCPDGYCLRQGEIHRVGQTIVCLPHRVVAEIKADSLTIDDDAIDAIVH